MGGCMSLDVGPAGTRRDPGFQGWSPSPPAPPPAVFPEDEPVVKQALPDTRRQPLSPLPVNDEKADYFPPGSPVKAKATSMAADLGGGTGRDDGPPSKSSPSRLPTPPLGSTVRSASAREHLEDRSGMQQPEMMMMMMTRGSQGMLGRRSRSLRESPSSEERFLTGPEKQRKPAGGPGKETLENPLVSLECFIFL